jgi:uncharacterized protein DUF2183
VLVGDSGERDPEIYAALRAEFPGRVAAIFIRDAGRAEDPRRFERMFLFKEPEAAAREAAAVGVADLACVERAYAPPSPATEPVAAPAPAPTAPAAPTPPAGPPPPPPGCPACPCPCPAGAGPGPEGRPAPPSPAR